MGFSSTGSALRLGEFGADDGAGVGCIRGKLFSVFLHFLKLCAGQEICSEGIEFN